jgi:hypothetical protein
MMLLEQYGVTISEKEWDHYFESINFVDQENFSQKLKDIGRNDKETAELAERAWGFQDQEKIYINPIKNNGKSIHCDSRVISHEVLHQAAEFLDKNRNVKRIGLMTNENTRQLAEIITDELACMLGDEHEILFSLGHDLVNVLITLAPFDLWVKANFTEDGYKALKQEIETKLGNNAFKIISLLCKYNMAFELSKFIESGKLTLPQNIDEETKEEFDNLE